LIFEKNLRAFKPLLPKLAQNEIRKLKNLFKTKRMFANLIFEKVLRAFKLLLPKMTQIE
jgi:hypothetical protein